MIAASPSASREFLPQPARTVIAIAAAVALVPYAALKVLWLFGSDIGMVKGTGEGHMDDARFEIGNVVTVALVLLGALVVLTLTRPWSQLLPWWSIIIPAAGATGCLAPIALGIPVGVLIQGLFQGNVHSGGEGNLSGAVFGVVYGGFGLFGIALAVLLADYVRRRWNAILDTGPIPPRKRWVRILAAAGSAPLACACIAWAFATGSVALPGWESLAQRVVLVAIGALTLLGNIALLLPASVAAPHARWILGWVGCCTAALQGPVLLILSNDSSVNPVLLAVTLIATPTATALVLTSIHHCHMRVQSPPGT